MRSRLIIAVALAAALATGGVTVATAAAGDDSPEHPWPNDPPGVQPNYNGAEEVIIDPLTSVLEDALGDEYVLTGGEWLWSRTGIDDDAVWEHYDSELIGWTPIGTLVDIDSRAYRTWERDDQRFAAVIVPLRDGTYPDFELLLTFEVEHR